jgi:sugar O-acyltransferase (sialic acid O-acetyltransferase NeuD family)
MKKAVFGNGGHSREVISYFDFDVQVFVDDEYAKGAVLPISLFDPNEYEIMIAISNSKVRESIVKNLPSNTRFFSFVHPSSILSGNIDIQEGCFIGPNCILTTNIKIGKHALLNRGIQIGHDCSIGDFFSAMPGSIISGTNTIGNRVYFGANSTTREKITITNDCTFGLNSGIVKDITEPGTYVGTPSNKIK